MNVEKLVNILWRTWWIVLVICIIIMCISGIARAEQYSLTTVVVSIDYDTNIVECIDFNGNIWAFDGCDDWYLFDVCSMIMDDMDTDIIYDDSILNYRYDGWLTGWFERVCR